MTLLPPMTQQDKLLIIGSLAKKMERATNKWVALKQDLAKNCDRTCGNVKAYEAYLPGSYLDKASTVYGHECEVCGFYEQIDHKTHSWYG